MNDRPKKHKRTMDSNPQKSVVETRPRSRARNTGREVVAVRDEQRNAEMGDSRFRVQDSESSDVTVRKTRRRKKPVISYRKALFCAARLKGAVTRAWPYLTRSEKEYSFMSLRSAERYLKKKEREGQL